MNVKLALFTTISLCFLLSAPVVCFPNERLEPVGKGFYTRFAIGKTMSNNFKDAVKARDDKVQTSLNVAGEVLTGDALGVLIELLKRAIGGSNSELEADF